MENLLKQCGQCVCMWRDQNWTSTEKEFLALIAMIVKSVCVTVRVDLEEDGFEHLRDEIMQFVNGEDIDEK